MRMMLRSVKVLMMLCISVQVRSRTQSPLQRVEPCYPVSPSSEEEEDDEEEEEQEEDDYSDED